MRRDHREEEVKSHGHVIEPPSTERERDRERDRERETERETERERERERQILKRKEE